jgi:hypothetical protein
MAWVSSSGIGVPLTFSLSVMRYDVRYDYI